MLELFFVLYINCAYFLTIYWWTFYFLCGIVLSKYLSSFSSQILLCLELSPTWCLKSHRRTEGECPHVSISDFFALQMQGCCCIVSINVVVAVFVHSTWSATAINLFQWRLRRHCIITADSNGDENTPCEFFQESDIVTCRWRKREQTTIEREQFGKHCHSSRREEVLWNRGFRVLKSIYRIIGHFFSCKQI